MKKITVMNQTAKATYEKGINDTNWTLKFFDLNGKPHTCDRGITTSALLEALKQIRETGYTLTMTTR